MKKLVVIDGKSVFYRGYHAMGHLSLKDGTPIGGVYGFAVIAMELVERIAPDKVVVAWDKAGTSIAKRKTLFEGYKAGRKKPEEDFFVQIPYLVELLKDLGWEFVECDEYEADDIIGTLAKQARESGEYETYIISSDLDMLQVVDEKTKMWRLLKGFSELSEVDVAKIEEKYGIAKRKFLDLKALKGDMSDNIPGVAGIGEKTAVRILNEVEDIEELYGEVIDEAGELVRDEGELAKVLTKTTRKKLIEGKEMAFLSKKLAKIMTDAPVDLMKLRDFVWDGAKMAESLRKLEFVSLVRKFGLDKYASGDIKSEGVKLLPEGLIVEWDIKSVMHKDEDLARRILSGEKFYDLGQGRFLLDPLERKADFEDFLDKYASGDIKAEEYWRQQEEFAKEKRLQKVRDELDFPLIPVLYKMEKVGMRISKEFFTQLNREMEEEVGKLEQEVWDLAGVKFNVNSPMQLSEVLFEKMGLDTKGIKKNKKFYSTGVKELQKLESQHPIAKKIREYREWSKLLSTYVMPLPKLADEKARIHTTFTQNVTATGRLSSLTPNLQNIPTRTEEGRKIRKGFEVEEGRILVSADYAQFELRLAGALANDEGLIADFNAGLDIHTKTAADVFGVEMEEVSSEQRRAAKVINFGVLYGMSANGLAEAAKMSFGEASGFIKDYFKVRRKIREFLDDILLMAKEKGYVETLFGRRRPMPDILSKNFIVRGAAERAAINMPIQGTEADLMKKAMIAIDKKLPKGAEMVCQVHDSLIVECDEDMAKEVAEMLKMEMENVASELPVKLAVDIKMGKNWGEL